MRCAAPYRGERRPKRENAAPGRKRRLAKTAEALTFLHERLITNKADDARLRLSCELHDVG